MLTITLIIGLTWKPYTLATLGSRTCLLSQETRSVLKSTPIFYMSQEPIVYSAEKGGAQIPSWVPVHYYLAKSYCQIPLSKSLSVFDLFQDSTLPQTPQAPT